MIVVVQEGSQDISNTHFTERAPYQLIMAAYIKGKNVTVTIAKEIRFRERIPVYRTARLLWKEK